MTSSERTFRPGIAALVIGTPLILAGVWLIGLILLKVNQGSSIELSNGKTVGGTHMASPAELWQTAGVGLMLIAFGDYSILGRLNRRLILNRHGIVSINVFGRKHYRVPWTQIERIEFQPMFGQGRDYFTIYALGRPNFRVDSMYAHHLDFIDAVREFEPHVPYVVLDS